MRPRGATDLGPDAAIMLRHDRATLQALPLHRQIAALFEFFLENPAQLLSYATITKLYGFPADYWDTYPAKIMAITADDVQRRPFLGRRLGEEQGAGREVERPRPCQFLRAGPVGIGVAEADLLGKYVEKFLAE